MSRSIDYGNLMHDAMRSLIRDVLTDVAENGLPGAHHFFISFETHHPEVEIADWLADRFPEDMTVVMQHWFDKLEVDEDGFAVTLNFGDQPERMYIPFNAIRTFVDPSVEFGLRFESQDVEDDEDDAELSPLAKAKFAKDKAAKDKAKAAGAGKSAGAGKPAARDKTGTGASNGGGNGKDGATADADEAKPDAEVVSLDSFRK